MLIVRQINQEQTCEVVFIFVQESHCKSVCIGVAAASNKVAACAGDVTKNKPSVAVHDFLKDPAAKLPSQTFPKDALGDAGAINNMDRIFRFFGICRVGGWNRSEGSRCSNTSEEDDSDKWVFTSKLSPCVVTARARRCNEQCVV